MNNPMETMVGERKPNQTAFYVVFDPTLNQPPKVGFWDENQAKASANTMSLRHAPNKFYVLRAAYSAQFTDPDNMTFESQFLMDQIKTTCPEPLISTRKRPPIKRKTARSEKI